MTRTYRKQNPTRAGSDVRGGEHRACGQFVRAECLGRQRSLSGSASVDTAATLSRGLQPPLATRIMTERDDVRPRRAAGIAIARSLLATNGQEVLHGSAESRRRIGKSAEREPGRWNEPE